MYLMNVKDPSRSCIVLPTVTMYVLFEITTSSFQVNYNLQEMIKDSVLLHYNILHLCVYVSYEQRLLFT